MTNRGHACPPISGDKETLICTSRNMFLYQRDWRKSSGSVVPDRSLVEDKNRKFWALSFVYRIIYRIQKEEPLNSQLYQVKMINGFRWNAVKMSSKVIVINCLHYTKNQLYCASIMQQDSCLVLPVEIFQALKFFRR